MKVIKSIDLKQVLTQCEVQLEESGDKVQVYLVKSISEVEKISMLVTQVKK